MKYIHIFIHSSFFCKIIFCFRKKTNLKKCKKNYLFVIICKIMHNCVMSNIFLHFSKTSNTKINSLIIFNVFTLLYYYYYFYYTLHIIISITLKSNSIKGKEMYEHVSYFVYVWLYVYEYLCMFIHIYTYSSIKNFLLRHFELFLNIIKFSSNFVY